MKILQTLCLVIKSDFEKQHTSGKKVNECKKNTNSQDTRYEFHFSHIMANGKKVFFFTEITVNIVSHKTKKNSKKRVFSLFFSFISQCLSTKFPINERVIFFEKY